VSGATIYIHVLLGLAAAVMVAGGCYYSVRKVSVDPDGTRDATHGGAHNRQNSVAAVEQLVERLNTFYLQREMPEKLEGVPILARDYVGREEVLFRRLNTKYPGTLGSAVVVGPTEVYPVVGLHAAQMNNPDVLPVADVVAVKAAPVLDIVHQLRELRQMVEEGLITQDDYDRKKVALLDIGDGDGDGGVSPRADDDGTMVTQNPLSRSV
jgi:hypothetical protein